MIINDIEIPKYLFLTEPISKQQLTDYGLVDFDSESFNLSMLEYMYHIASGFKPHNAQFMGGCWFVFDPTDLQHICLYANYKFRFAYAGAARKQLEQFSAYNPSLKKFLQIRPAYQLKALIQKHDGITFKDDTVVNYVGTSVDEFVLEKQYQEEYINKKYYIDGFKIR